MLTFARLQLFELFLETSTIGDLPVVAQHRGDITDTLVFVRIEEELLVAFDLANSSTLELCIYSVYTTVTTIEVNTAQQRGTQCIVISRFVTA